MTPDEQAHIFEPFYRGSNKEVRPSGTGLGLCIVKHVVEASGGTVEICSERGKGTTVTLTLPLKSEQ
jgi:signal transduction histidine kinase